MALQNKIIKEAFNLVKNQVKAKYFIDQAISSMELGKMEPNKVMELLFFTMVIFLKAYGVEMKLKEDVVSTIKMVINLFESTHMEKGRALELSFLQLVKKFKVSGRAITMESAKFCILIQKYI